MRFSVGRKSLPALMGGMEHEYGIIFPGLTEPDEEGSAGYRFYGEFSSAVDEEAAACGGSLEGLDLEGDGLSKRFLADGGALGFENVNVVEISSPECLSPLEALAYVEKHEETFRRAIRRMRHLPAKTVLSGGPACLPHFGPGHGPGWQLGFHLNFNARLTPRAAAELRAAMVAVLPLTAAGGLTEKGFRTSPLGRMICRGYAPGRSALAHLNIFSSSAAAVADGGGGGEFHREARLHIPCLDRPLTRRMKAFVFTACQLMLTLLMYGEDLMGGYRLANPARAYSVVADSEYGRRFRLEGGGLASLTSLQEALRASLVRIRTEYDLAREQEHAADLLIRGIEAFTAGDEDFLSESLDGCSRRKRIYEAVLRDEGLSLPFFDNIAAPLVYHACKLGIRLHELAQLGGREAQRFVGRAAGNEICRSALLERLNDNRLTAAEIPAFARLLQRIITLEVGLYRLYPCPAPLHDLETASWEDFLRAVGGRPPGRATGRAARRARLIRSIPEEARRFCLADWSGIYMFPARESMGIYSLPSPYSDEANLSWAYGDEADRLLEDMGLDEVVRLRRYLLGPDHGGCAGDEAGEVPGAGELLRLRDLGMRPHPRQLHLL